MKGLVLILLAILAGLQFHWINQMSRSEKVRMEALFHLTGQQITSRFQREMSELGRSFRGQISNKHQSRPKPSRMWVELEDLSQWISNGLEQWQVNSLFPEIIKSLYVVGLDKPNEGEASSLEEWDREQAQLIPSQWPADMPQLKIPQLNRRRQAGPLYSFIQLDLPGVYLPFLIKPESGHNARERRMVSLLVLFNRDVIARQFLPQIFEEVMGETGDHSVRMRVLDQKGVAIFDSHADQNLPSYMPVSMGRFFPSSGGMGGGDYPETEAECCWKLQVFHVKGDLDTVIHAFRWRHMFLGGLVLIMVAASTLLVQKNARRSTQLARKQIDFVAGISHELLTPLAGIQSAGENLAEGLVKDELKIRSYGSMIAREGKRLSNLVTQILQFSKIESHGNEANREQCSLNELIQQSINTQMESLEQVGIEISLLLPEKPVLFFMDREAMLRVFNNLIENTCKYAASGKMLEIGIVETEGQILIRFRNEGPPIPSEECEEIFSPFTRGRQVVASAISGTGLGLHLVKSIVESHGGTISVQSSSKSTLFEIGLPRGA